MRIVVSNNEALLIDCPPYVLRHLDKLFSYPIEGAWFSMAYRRGRWDGRVHLIRVRKREGYVIPIGLVPDLIRACGNLEVPIKVDSVRNESGEELAPHRWISKDKARPYQKQAVKAFLSGSDGFEKLGILKMPVRAGKTLTAAMLIERCNARTLFVVPSILLLNQTVEAFQRCFEGLTIGTLGAGEHTVGDVTVATFQTLMNGWKAGDSIVIEAVMEARLLIVDECHHLEADDWRRPIIHCPAPWRCGLSATAYVSSKRPSDVSVVWLKAVCGPVLFEVEMGYLMKKGWLVQTEIQIHLIQTPSLRGEYWSKETYTRAITKNRERNRLICELARKAVRKGKTVLIDIGRIEHGRILRKRLDEFGLRTVVLTHKDPKDYREQVIERFRERKLDVIVSTLLGEGVNIPELDVVINAEGGASRKSTIQRLRNLTPAEGKHGATVIDFEDRTHEYLERHSKSRIKAYKKERCFEIKFFDGDRLVGKEGEGG